MDSVQTTLIIPSNCNPITRRRSLCVGVGGWQKACTLQSDLKTPPTRHNQSIINSDRFFIRFGCIYSSVCYTWKLKTCQQGAISQSTFSVQALTAAHKWNHCVHSRLHVVHCCDLVVALGQFNSYIKYVAHTLRLVSLSSNYLWIICLSFN